MYLLSPVRVGGECHLQGVSECFVAGLKRAVFDQKNENYLALNPMHILRALIPGMAFFTSNMPRMGTALFHQTILPSTPRADIGSCRGRARKGALLNRFKYEKRY